MGGEGFLTLTIKMRVRPEPGCEEELVATSLSRAHALLYRELKEKFALPSRIAMDCYREALSIAKSWLGNPNKGTMPKAKTLRLWLTSLSYRIKGNYVEVLGGYRLRIVGRDRRYDQYPSGEARLMYKEGKFFLMIYKRLAERLRRGILKRVRPLSNHNHSSSQQKVFITFDIYYFLGDL